MKMQDKVALVTGAALGYKEGGPTIGGSIARVLASEGASVVVVDINDTMGERSAQARQVRLHRNCRKVIGRYTKTRTTPLKSIMND